MCSGCNRVWSIFHVTWSVLYVTSGAAQLVAGIFFLLAIPSLVLGCNLITGLWNICMGIGVGMVACCGQVSPRRQEYLLYMTISILIANVVNAVANEWGFYHEDLPKLLARHQYHLLVHYASLATRLAAAAVIGVSFVDSQLTFCSMQATRPSAKKKLRGSHEQVSDIEYIIPRPKPAKPQAFSAYNTQSWVFESDNVNAATHASAASTAAAAPAPSCGKAARLASAPESPYLKLPQDARPPRRAAAGKSKGDLENGVVIVADTTYLINHPMVHVEDASDDSASNSDRKLCYMKSFSRSASPAVLSASSSQASLADHQQQRRRRQQDEGAHYQTPQAAARPAGSPQIGQAQYASLVQELQRAIGSKASAPASRSASGTRTQTASQSSSRQDGARSAQSSDAEFSKELEAALQLIQDLESPNTIETPSDAKRQRQAWRGSRSDSERTLSAVGSLAEAESPSLAPAECHRETQELCTFKPSANGKSARIVVQCSDSQSTSGYSSPTHNKGAPQCWSTASSLNGSSTDLGGPLSYTIHNTKSTAVISLFTAHAALRRGKSVTLVNITGDNQPLHAPPPPHAPSPATPPPQPPKASATPRTAALGSSWNVKSLLRRKKHAAPKLCPELEGAIVKSESLAYLTELELLARHQRNKDIQRQIEQRVQQQLGTPWTDAD